MDQLHQQHFHLHLTLHGLDQMHFQQQWHHQFLVFHVVQGKLPLGRVHDLGEPQLLHLALNHLQSLEDRSLHLQSKGLSQLADRFPFQI